MVNIKEDRVSREDPSLNNPFFDALKTKSTEDKFDKRAQIFWEDMFGVFDLLNDNNKKVTLSSIESPIITNYLLWRILSEFKLYKVDTKNIKQSIKDEIKDNLDL